MTQSDKIDNMSEFDDAHAFVDGFFAALEARAPQSASLKWRLFFLQGSVCDA